MIGQKLLGLGLAVMLCTGGVNSAFAQQKTSVGHATYLSEQAGALPAHLGIYHEAVSTTSEIKEVTHKHYKSGGYKSYKHGGYGYGNAGGSCSCGCGAGYARGAAYGAGYSYPSAYSYSAGYRGYGYPGYGGYRYSSYGYGRYGYGAGVRSVHYGNNYAYPLRYPMPYGYTPSYGYYGSVSW